jgi:hypothetical protein
MVFERALFAKEKGQLPSFRAGINLSEGKAAANAPAERKPISFSEEHAQTLSEITSYSMKRVGDVDKNAPAIIKAFRDRYSGGIVPQGQKLPSPPPVLQVMQEPEKINIPAFNLFLKIHESLQREIAKRTHENPPSGGKSLRDASMSMLGIGDLDYDKAGVVIQNINQRLKETHKELIQYSDECKKSKRLVDPIIIRQFTLKRQQIVAAGIAELEAAISTAGWQNLRIYLNGTLKSQIRYKTLPMRP